MTLHAPLAATLALANSFVLDRPVKNFLHGVWLGHPLHPLLPDVPIGAWTAAVLDGPSTFDQPCCEPRVRNGHVEVRAAPRETKHDEGSNENVQAEPVGGNSMDISRLMTKNVEVVGPDATLQEAARKMKDIDVGSLPVCNGRKLLGMLTDRDVTIRAVAEGRDPKQTKVKDVMTADVVYGRTSQAVHEIAEMLASHQIRRLPIVNDDNELVGIVALGDLAVDAGDERLGGDVLADVSTPAKPKR